MGAGTFGCHFIIVSISNKMMVNVDALTHNCGHLISHHISTAALLSSRNQSKHPCAYATNEFSDLGNVNITETDNPSRYQPSFLTRDVLRRFLKISTLIQPQPLH